MIKFYFDPLTSHQVNFGHSTHKRTPKSKTCFASNPVVESDVEGNIYAAAGVFSIIIKFIYHPFLPLRQCFAYSP